MLIEQSIKIKFILYFIEENYAEFRIREQQANYDRPTREEVINLPFFSYVKMPMRKDRPIRFVYNFE